MRNLCILSLAVFWCSSCSPISKRSLDKSFISTDKKFQDHTGFVLYDLEKKKTLYDYRGSHYFTPGSNTKIFTFFSCITLLGDSVPALKYFQNGDSLIFWGTGDPSFLYKEVYEESRVFSFLKSTPLPLYFSDVNFHTTHFGSGWAWDDYNDYYSPERSSFPMYGNILSVHASQNDVHTQPPYFKNYLKVESAGPKSKVIRRLESNEFTFHPAFLQMEFKADVPFKVTAELTTHLLSDTLKKIVRLIKRPLLKSATTLYSVPVDSLYKTMMQESDNFIAEQLLLLCSQAISDSLKPEIAIRYVKENFLKDLADDPRWVDGSGLSRYNLFTPRSIVQLWEKIYQRMPHERLFPLLAAGGKSGTIKNWYDAERPYIFGKTGSLSNNHCLSGFLVAKSGRILIFSFMNNNFISPVNDVRKNMANILKLIYESY